MCYKNINFKELQSLLKENTVLIDVRTTKEYEVHSLPYSSNLPLTDVDLNKVVNLCSTLCEEKRITKNKPINLVFYCRSGIRSLQAIENLIEEDDVENNVLVVNNYEFNIFNLKGGILGIGFDCNLSRNI